MRVITGIARGRRLDTLAGEAVRPTSDKIKEAIFSALQFDLEGRVFLDLFAGSGQMGIEALSRGAKISFFVDNSSDSINIIKSNLKKCGFEKDAVVFKSDYSSFLTNSQRFFDIAFLDPPYSANILIDSLNKVCDRMSDYGIILCEHPVIQILPQKIKSFKMYKQYKYGKILISAYRKMGNSDE